MKELVQRLWLLSRKTIITAMGGFVFWTLVLTPYMIYVVKVSAQQYWRWVFGAQLILIPILSLISVWFMNWAVKILMPKPEKETQWPR